MTTTLAKIKANQKNGKLSNGPKTARGKASAKMNAVSHGLRSLSPVLPGERPKDWNDRRAGVVATLAPVGTLETELAERVALLLWRLRRVVRYETEVTSAAIDAAVGHVRGEKDDENPLNFVLRTRSNPRTIAKVEQELQNARGCATGFAETSEQLRKLLTLPAEHRFDGGEAYCLLREVGAYTPGGAEEYFEIEDHSFLAEIGVPKDWCEDADWWTGGTPGSSAPG
jgi:hypothetical protein